MKLKVPFSGKDESIVMNNIRNGKYKHIERGFNYSDELINLVEKMMCIV
jgi:hypothetical protein